MKHLNEFRTHIAFDYKSDAQKIPKRIASKKFLVKYFFPRTICKLVQFKPVASILIFPQRESS